MQKDTVLLNNFWEAVIIGPYKLELEKKKKKKRIIMK